MLPYRYTGTSRDIPLGNCPTLPEGMGGGARARPISQRPAWTIPGLRIIVGANEIGQSRERPSREDVISLRMIGFALSVSFFVVPAFAEETVKIGYIDPLSGGGASVGEIGLKTFQYLRGRA